MSKPKPDLTPPDPERCQAERKVGCWPDARHFLNLGPAQMLRCDRKPVVIATEKRPGKDGQYGSMSLCGECLTALLEQVGPNHCSFKNI